MIPHQLPELAVKASNEAKTITMVLKYFAFVSVAVCTVVVCALFVKVSLLPVEPYGPVVGKVVPIKDRKPVHQDKEQLYVVGVNIEFEPEYSSTVQPKIDIKPTVQSANKETTTERRNSLKNKLLNSHVFQSVKPTKLAAATEVSTAATSETNNKETSIPNLNKVEFEKIDAVKPPDKDEKSETGPTILSFFENPLKRIFHPFFFPDENKPIKLENKINNPIHSDNVIDFHINPKIDFEESQFKPINVFFDDSKETIYKPIDSMFDTRETVFWPLDSKEAESNSNENQFIPIQPLSNFRKSLFWPSVSMSDSKESEINSNENKFIPFHSILDSSKPLFWPYNTFTKSKESEIDSEVNQFIPVYSTFDSEENQFIPVYSTFDSEENQFIPFYSTFDSEESSFLPHISYFDLKGNSELNQFDPSSSKSESNEEIISPVHFFNTDIPSKPLFDSEESKSESSSTSNEKNENIKLQTIPKSPFEDFYKQSFSNFFEDLF